MGRDRNSLNILNFCEKKMREEKKDSLDFFMSLAKNNGQEQSHLSSHRFVGNERKKMLEHPNWIPNVAFFNW